MTVAAQITRLQGAKADLKTSIEAKGVTVPSATLISGYAALVDQIETGGGGGIPDSDGLIDIEIANGDQSGVSSFILLYLPKYLLKYTPSSAVSTVGGFTIPQTAVTYPNVVWTCDNPSLTISGSTVTVPTGTNGNVTFTATWTDYDGNTRTTTKTINVVNLQYVWLTVFSASGSGYFVTTEWPSNLSITNYTTYNNNYICRITGTVTENWGGDFQVLSNNGSTASIFNSVDAAKAALDSM